MMYSILFFIFHDVYKNLIFHTNLKANIFEVVIVVVFYVVMVFSYIHLFFHLEIKFGFHGFSFGFHVVLNNIFLISNLLFFVLLIIILNMYVNIYSNKLTYYWFMDNIQITEVSILKDPRLTFLRLNMATRAHSAGRYIATLMILVF